jgi:hypothetical protein
MQQPIEHDVESHTHSPPLHSVPELQLVQVAPPVPHCVFDGVVTQCWVVGSQHPAQLVASQTHWPWALHFWSEPHAMHAAPLAPHWVLLVGETHVLPVPQQPLHMVPPQEHCPLVHESPPEHAPHARPPLPQVPELCIENGTHWPLVLQQPLGQVLGPQVGPESPCPSEPPPVSVGTSAVTSVVTSGPGPVSVIIVSPPPSSPPPSATDASPA